MIEVCWSQLKVSEAKIRSCNFPKLFLRRGLAELNSSSLHKSAKSHTLYKRNFSIDI